MITTRISAVDRKQARDEARAMGVLNGSNLKGRGNELGMMGEILTHRLIGGERVGHCNYAYDIVTPAGITVDVKTSKGYGAPEPHIAARIYGGEKDRKRLSTKCQVYFFVRCNRDLNEATLIGWLPTKVFFKFCEFDPLGSVNPFDGRITNIECYSLPISELYSPKLAITPGRVR